ncbi:MAG: ImmA/IrrE family metallo-endopeptidase [Actinomycetota bacterium]|nr:ImmA/IrrE family metallo-endopeptidase [Actinomycetota bacterium]
MTQPLDNLKEIRDVVAALLRKADVDERLPTPVDDLVTAVGLLEDADYFLSGSKISQAPKELRRFLRGAARKIRGALDRRERIIHVSPTVEVPAQRQFIRCHEIIHDALPWQRDLLVLGDTSKTLAPDIQLRFEREANQGGAELLFQLDLLARVARDYPTEIATPVALAELFGASIHSTFRRWIEHHPGIAAGIVLDTEPVSVSPLTFRRFEIIESDGWRQRFGTNRFPVRVTTSTHPFIAPLRSAWSGELDTTWELNNNAGSPAALRVQSFHNSYRRFLLVWQPGKESLIARRRRQRLIVG